MSLRRSAMVLAALLLAVTLTSCGGGSEPEPGPGGSSRWDELVWDRDHWA